MKSLGQRLVAGLNNWRSRKKGVSPDETPDTGSIASESPKQSDHEMAEQLSIKATTTDTNKTDATASQATEPDSLPGALTSADEPQASVKAIGDAEPLPDAETKDIVPAPSVARKPVQKRPRAKKSSTKVTDSPAADAGLAALDAQKILTGETHDDDGTVGDDREQRNNLFALVAVPDTDQDGRKVAGTTEPENPPEAFAQADGPRSLEEPPSQRRLAKGKKTDEIAAIGAISAPPRKRSRAGKSKAGDELVTNRELAALEAENARLKRLLSEKLLVKRVDPEN